MKNYISALTLFIFFNANAQQQKIDSLKSVLPGLKEDTIKIKTLNLLSETYVFGTEENDSAVKYAKQAITISEGLMPKADGISLKALKKNMGASYNNLGLIADKSSKYDEALNYYKKSLQYRKEADYKKGMAGSFQNIGIIYHKQGHYAIALEYYFKALKINEELNNKSWIARNYTAIGNLNEETGNNLEALKAHTKALQLYREVGEKGGIPGSLVNIGNAYKNLQNYSQAKNNYLEAIKSEGIDIFQESIAHSGLGNIYLNADSLDEALNHYLMAYELKKTIDDKYGFGTMCSNIGTIYVKKKKYELAEKYLQSGLKASEEMGEKKGQKDCLEELMKCSEAKGNSKEALSYYKKYAAVKDSLLNLENTKSLNEMKVKYETEKKDNQIALLNKDKEIQTAQIKRQTLIKNSILGGVGITGIFSFLLIRSFNRKRKTAFEKEVSQVEMKALRSQMNPHFIFNSLQSIKKFILENERNVAAEYLSKFSKVMRLILENSREQEVPLEKDLNALELYMELEALRFQNSFQYKIEIDPQIDKETTLIPPMILQPFVENSIIHGVRTKANGLITIKIIKENNMIRCCVEDNGIGREQSVKIETGEEKKHESLAMIITQERLSIISRLKKVKAAMNIFDLKDSQNNPGGLRVELLLPFETAF